MNLHVIATYTDSAQEIFKTDVDREIFSNDVEVAEKRLLHILFTLLRRPRDLETLSVAEVVEDGLKTVPLGRNGKWYFNTDFNKDADTAEDKALLLTWLLV
jgi:hypothetical protein